MTAANRRFSAPEPVGLLRGSRRELWRGGALARILETLSQTQARSGDGLGATLRLLAMMALNGNIWFDQALGEVAAD